MDAIILTLVSINIVFTVVSAVFHLRQEGRLDALAAQIDGHLQSLDTRSERLVDAGTALTATFGLILTRRIPNDDDDGAVTDHTGAGLRNSVVPGQATVNGGHIRCWPTPRQMVGSDKHRLVESAHCPTHVLRFAGRSDRVDRGNCGTAEVLPHKY